METKAHIAERLSIDGAANVLGVTRLLLADRLQISDGIRK